ncbi:MAG: UvrB/UvrC motif-containing protein [Clostridioides difficile]|nr:UvrB/UvrC motif-containing protein [Clostridioides difficile]
MKELKEDLDRAIKNEEYELAAQFRDKIKYLKGSID